MAGDIWALGRQAHKFLRDHVQAGSVVVELGSGSGTAKLAERFSVVTVEHDPQYVGRVGGVVYIHAPIVNGWYNVDDLRQQLPPKYAALIIDGPPGDIGRSGILQHLDLFDWSVPVLVDDCQRPVDFALARQLERVTGRTLQVYADSYNKVFGTL